MTDIIADGLNFPGNAAYMVTVLLMIMALCAMLSQKNSVKLCVGVSILSSAVHMLLVSLSYRSGASLPIITHHGDSLKTVLPISQFFALSSIVIAFAVIALMLSLVILIHRHYGTLDIDEVKGGGR